MNIKLTMEATRLRHLLPAASLSAPPSLPPPIHLFYWTSSGPYYYTASASDSVRCWSRPDIRKPSWDAAGTERSKFYPYSELYDDDYDDDDDDDDDDAGGMFGFGEGKKKQRKWWSDDDDDDEEDAFWGFKILKVFGWMVPAILISMLLGTGPNALFMAVALPLGQTALSLAVDKVWGVAQQTSKPRSRTRTRSKPFAGTSSTTRARKRKQDADCVGSRESKSPPSSTEYNEPAQVNVNHASTSFGGWDELDWDVEVRSKMEEDEQKRQKKSNKVSKRGRSRDSPFFIRLLVAVFPLLGSWARFL